MADPDFERETAHRYFSANCFNKASELIKRVDRTPDEDEEMVRLTQASLWHWTQRTDCTSMNMSIGYWQASRVQAILGRAEEARRYGHLCLAHSPQESPFLLAYAREALARAENVAGNRALAAEHRAEAGRLAERVTDAEDRELLLMDLATIT